MMVQISFLIVISVALLVAALRWARTRRQRRLRESSHARRAERDKRWEETSGQVSTDDWRT
jgi:type II secretory pathway pseudopilin PulG